MLLKASILFTLCHELWCRILHIVSDAMYVYTIPILAEEIFYS